MIVLVLLFLGSLGAIVAALAAPGLSDLPLLAVPCGLASLFLLLRAFRAQARMAAPSAAKWIVVDGSNVLHWNDGTPKIETVREVLKRLADHGYTPGIVFDANAGYLISGSYKHDVAFGKLLGLPEDRVLVVDKGTPADPAILVTARDLGARIVTNDRYRDWAVAHPEVNQPGHLIRGGYRQGKLWTALDDPAT